MPLFGWDLGDAIVEILRRTLSLRDEGAAPLCRLIRYRWLGSQTITGV